MPLGPLKVSDDWSSSFASTSSLTYLFPLDLFIRCMCHGAFHLSSLRGKFAVIDDWYTSKSNSVAKFWVLAIIPKFGLVCNIIFLALVSVFQILVQYCHFVRPVVLLFYVWCWCQWYLGILEVVTSILCLVYLFRLVKNCWNVSLWMANSPQTRYKYKSIPLYH